MKTDFFKSTAWYYARFRPPYPGFLFDEIRERYDLDGTGTLLDIGCGTGQLALSLAPHFFEVVGMDPEEEMLEEARSQARLKSIEKVCWVRGDSGDLSGIQTPLRLVTMGRCFHWMDRGALLDALHPKLEQRGGVVITGERPMWEAREPFEHVVKALTQELLGPKRRAGSSFYKSCGVSHQEVISASRFSRFDAINFPWRRGWTVDQIIGHCYSTSFVSLHVLGDLRDRFEDELRRRLLLLDPGGVFVENTELAVYFLHV